FALEALITKRHALEMIEINRAIIGNQRRRWHPFDPLQMKRHGVRPDVPARDVAVATFGSQSWNWLTERFAYRWQIRPQVCLDFAGQPPQFAGSCKKSVYH